MATGSEFHRGEMAYTITVQGIMGFGTQTTLTIDKISDPHFLVALNIDPASFTVDASVVTIIDLIKKGQNRGTHVQTVFSTTDTLVPEDKIWRSVTYNNFAVPGGPGDEFFEHLADAGVTIVSRTNGIQVIRLPTFEDNPTRAREDCKQGLALLSNWMGVNKNFHPKQFDWAAGRVLADPQAPDLMKDLLSADPIDDSLKTSPGIPIAIRIPKFYQSWKDSGHSKRNHLPPIGGSLKRIVGASRSSSFYGVAVIPDLYRNGENVGYAAVEVTPGEGTFGETVLLTSHVSPDRNRHYIEATGLWDIKKMLTNKLKPVAPRGIHL